MKSIIVVAFSLTACVAMQYPSAFLIPYAIEDSPKEARIYVKYKNEIDKDICLYPTNWPNKNGEIDSGKGRVFINVGGKSYSAEDFDSGYCPGCVLRVAPGHEEVGFFNYTDFDLPPTDYEKEKSLTFSPMANYCR